MESIPPRPAPFLVVDDDQGLLLAVKATVMSSGMGEPAVVSDPRRVFRIMEERQFPVVLLDLLMPHMNGLEVLKRLKEEFPATECVMVTAVDDVGTAVGAMKAGAFDYLTKPLDKDKLIIVMGNALEHHRLRHELALYHRSPSFDELREREAFDHMVAEDEQMARLFLQAENVAASGYHALITGETGTGKEMLARGIHRAGPRKDGPFVAVNVTALSRALFESSFFGHVKGAFTGADEERKGYFQAAHGGVLFLDELTELDMDLQAKFLRVVEEMQVYPLGSTSPCPVDVQVLTATNKDIHLEMKEGSFRKDLYYRLSRCLLHLPPLRERSGDIIPLAEHFLSVHAQRQGRSISRLSPELSRRLRAYAYPGNVRELENMIARAVLAETGEELGVADAGSPPGTCSTGACISEEPATLAQVERHHILQVLERHGGNRSRAARSLGIGLRTLQRKLKSYDR